jgi:hypothetical protein
MGSGDMEVEEGGIMFLFFIVVGCFSIIIGYISIFRPGTIIKLSRVANRLIITDYGYVRHHKLSGALFLIIGAILFYVGFQIV